MALVTIFIAFVSTAIKNSEYMPIFDHEIHWPEENISPIKVQNRYGNYLIDRNFCGLQTFA